MTDSDYTALLLIVDRSGSMTTIRDDMVGGLQQFIAEQTAQPGRLTIDYVQFDSEYERLTRLTPAAEITVSLEPRGATALWDAIGRGIGEFGSDLAAMPEDKRPGHVKVVIVTDGMENSSLEFTGETIKQIIQRQQETYAWGFTFLGANQDAIEAAASMGIGADDALTWKVGREGVRHSMMAMSARMTDERAGRAHGFTAAERSAAMRDDEE